MNLTCSKGLTPVIYAVAVGHREILMSLLTAGANVNYRDRTGKTPIMYAAALGRREILITLLTINCQPECMQVLIDLGAGLNLRCSHGKTAYDYAKDKARRLEGALSNKNVS